ncbi:MAG TPA: hypothetical protein VFE33_11210, partial [Thermoanaerobaculia bacterium]|nr:hypothetical protein [Thermoanaerobaculia bacterium]
QGTNSILAQLYKGRFPFLVGGKHRMSMVFLDDVVDGMVRVLERAPVGRDYLLAGEVTTLAALAAKIEALGGAKAPRLDLPVGLARAAAALVSPLFRLVGRRPPFTPSQLGSLTREWAFDDTRARTELGWTPRGLDEGLPPTLALFSG